MFLISMFLLVSLGPAQAPVNATGAREDIAQEAGEVAKGNNGSRQEGGEEEDGGAGLGDVWYHLTIVSHGTLRRRYLS